MQGHCKIIKHFRNILHRNINVNISMHQITKLPIYFSVLFVGEAGLSFAVQCKDHLMYNKRKKKSLQTEMSLSSVQRDESDRAHLKKTRPGVFKCL